MRLNQFALPLKLIAEVFEAHKNVMKVNHLKERTSAEFERIGQKIQILNDFLIANKAHLSEREVKFILRGLRIMFLIRANCVTRALYEINEMKKEFNTLRFERGLGL